MVTRISWFYSTAFYISLSCLTIYPLVAYIFNTEHFCHIITSGHLSAFLEPKYINLVYSVTTNQNSEEKHHKNHKNKM